MADAISHHAIIGEELAIGWADGTETYIPLAKLRRGCPCASCQGEPDAMGRVSAPPQAPLSDASFRLAGIGPVGGYALQPRWADGHSTGIYPFAYLRRLGAENPPA